MEQKLIDLSKIPKFQFEVNNDELKNCIKELHFQSKTQEKNILKIKKDVENRPTNNEVADALLLISASIDIEPALLKQLPNKNNNQEEEAPIVSASKKIGNKVSQVASLLNLLFQKNKQLQKKLDSQQSNFQQHLSLKFNLLQSQLDESKKLASQQTKSLSQQLQLNLHKYEQQLRTVQSKTLWQINDCQNKLQDRVTEQLVRDVVKEAEARIQTKVKQALLKSNIDPARIDQLESKAIKLQKELELKIVEVNAHLTQLKEHIQHQMVSKEEINTLKLQTKRKTDQLQISTSELNRKNKNNQQEINHLQDTLNSLNNKVEDNVRETNKLNKLMTTFKMSDDLLKLLEVIDPHKICEIDNSINILNEKHLKNQKEIENIKRYQEKFTEKAEICNLINPNESAQKTDKETVNKLVIDLIAANPTLKKVPVIEGSLYEFKAYGDMISELNKKIAKTQKEFDLQGVIYSVKGLEEYIKKQLLIMNTKISMLESNLAEEKKKRPISARKTAEGRITSSVSYKKLMPVDCISCFQNPIGERTPQQRKIFGNKY